MLARPDIERCSRELVDNRYGEPEPGEVDGLDVAARCVARVDAELIVRCRLEICELALVSLAAACAQHSSERPRRQAQGTQQRATAAIRHGIAGDLEYR